MQINWLVSIWNTILVSNGLNRNILIKNTLVFDLLFTVLVYPEQNPHYLGIWSTESVFLCLLVLHLDGINYDGITIYSKTSGMTKVTYSILVKSVVSNTFSLIFLRWARSSRTRGYGNLFKLMNPDGFVRKSIILKIKGHIKRYHCYLSW